MKKCPYCGEKIQNLAIKCRFCHEHLPENSDTIETKGELIPKKDYRRAGIIGLMFYIAALSNSNILRIGDRLREGQIVRVITTETQFLVGLLFIITGFIITKNKIVRRILGIAFGLSLLYVIGISLNYEQKEAERRMAIMLSTNECQKAFGIGSYGDGSFKIGGGYNCYCSDGYERNKENTKCITASESCNATYPGSISDGIKNEKGGYNCICPKNLGWNTKGNKCVTPTQLCKEQYGKDAYSNGYFNKNGYTTCYH